MLAVKSRKITDLSIFKAINLQLDDPEKVALRFANEDGSEETVSYVDIFENTNRIAHTLLNNGIGLGDTFTMVMKNHPEFIYTLFAALSIGAVAVPVDPRSKGRKLAFQILNTRSKGIIVADQFLESLGEIRDDIRHVPVIGVIYKDHHGVPHDNAYPALNEVMESESSDIPDQAIEFNVATPAQIIHTSGTTGDPKGVVLKADRFIITASWPIFCGSISPMTFPTPGFP